LLSVLAPEAADGVVPVLRDQHRPPGVAAPHNTVLLVCKTVEGLVVCLGEELVVEDPFGEREPVPLVLPQSDLVRDRRRKLAIAALQHLRMSVHVEELDNLVCRNSSSESLSDRFSSDQSDTQVRKSEEHFCEESEERQL